MAFIKDIKIKKKKELDAAGNVISPNLMSPNPPLIPETPTPKPETPKVNPTTPEVFKDQDTGRLSGVTMPNGSTFLGLNPREVQAQVGAFQQNTNLPQGTQLAGTAQNQADIQAQQVAFAANEKQSVNELEPAALQTNPFAQVPVLGAMGGALANVIFGTDTERLVARNKAERKVFKEGVSANDKFGAFIESIPILGSLTSKYAGGLIDTPSGSIQEMASQIATQKSLALDQQRNAKLSPQMREIAYDNVLQIEENMNVLEAKIKLMMIYSAEMRANPGQIDTIEIKILKTRQTLNRIKFNILNNQEIPTDEELQGALEE